MADAIENELVIRWGGQDYRQSQLTAADVIAMEDEWGCPFLDIEWGSMKAACWLVWLLRRHDEPDLPLEDVTTITMDVLAKDFQELAEQEAAKLPPTSGSRKRASGSGKSGGRGTKRSSG